MNRTIAPTIKDAVNLHVELKPYLHARLDNGVEVYAVEAGAQEVLQIEWVFYAGNIYEETNLVAGATNFLLKNGTQHKTAFDINEYFEYHGAYLNRNCSHDTAFVSLHTLNKNLEELFPVVAELFTEAIFPQEELDIYKQNNQQRLQVSLKKCDFVANRLIDEYLFGIHHPYGKYSTMEAYEALEREQLLSFYHQFYKNGKCIIFVAGRCPKNLFELLNKYFGTLPLHQHPLPEVHHPITQAAEKKYRIINDPEGVQGAIRMACHFPHRHHPDFPKAGVLNALFGGFFGSRLMSNIREDKGYTYGIYSYIQAYSDQSVWMISTEAGRHVCEATIQEVYKEMITLREELVDEDELMLVKNYMMGVLLGELDGPFAIISRWKNIIVNNLDEQYFYRTIDTIKNITPEEIQSIANEYFQPEHFYELAVV